MCNLDVVDDAIDVDIETAFLLEAIIIILLL